MTIFDALRQLFGRPNGQDGAGMSAGGMISCEEAAARLFGFLDGELESASEDEVRRHPDVCEACYPRVQFERHFLEALGFDSSSDLLSTWTSGTVSPTSVSDEVFVSPWVELDSQP